MADRWGVRTLEVSAFATVRDLITDGKVGHLGLSEASVETICRAHAVAIDHWLVGARRAVR
jgi:aryl-alcohol dehydrogenase-like predicted oxidoreductase